MFENNFEQQKFFIFEKLKIQKELENLNDNTSTLI